MTSAPSLGSPGSTESRGGDHGMSTPAGPDAGGECGRRRRAAAGVQPDGRARSRVADAAGRVAAEMTSPRSIEKFAVEGHTNGIVPAVAVHGAFKLRGTGHASIDLMRAGLPAGIMRTSSPTPTRPVLHASGDNAAIVELVDGLHRHAQRQVGRTQRVEKASSAARTVGPRYGAVEVVCRATPSPCARGNVGTWTAEP